MGLLRRHALLAVLSEKEVGHTHYQYAKDWLLVELQRHPHLVVLLLLLLRALPVVNELFL